MTSDVGVSVINYIEGPRAQCNDCRWRGGLGLKPEHAAVAHAAARRGHTVIVETLAWAEYTSDCHEERGS